MKKGGREGVNEGRRKIGREGERRRERWGEREKSTYHLNYLTVFPFKNIFINCKPSRSRIDTDR